MNLQEKLDKVDKALPSDVITALMIGIGITFILVGIYSESNLLKATMIAYTVTP